MQNLHKLKLGAELRRKVEAVICQQVKDAVAGAADRDSMLVDYSNYVEGLTPIQSSARWNGASNLQMPMIIKAHITVKSQIVQQIKRDPKATVTAIDPDDDRDAEAQEQFIVAKDHQCGLTSALADVINPTIMYPYGIMRVGWKEEWTWKRTVEYEDTETGERVAEENVDPDRDYTPVPIREKEQVFKGVTLDTIPTPDFYPYPANAIDIQKCQGCGHAILLSETDLLMGIATKDDVAQDYDEKSVYKLIEHGPCMLRDNEDAPLPDSELGVVFVGRDQDAMYECFEWYCQMPIIWNENGDLETPEYLIGEELRVVVCPSADTMLYLGLSEYQKPRPYVPFYILPRTGELSGMCLSQLLETLQTNVDVIAQEFTNSLQLNTSPVFKMKKSSEPLNEDAQFFPGAIFYYDKDPNEILPMESVPPNAENMQVLMQLMGLAEGIYAVQGIGQMDQKVRRAADIKNQQIQAGTKFDLFYFYFSGAGKEGTGVVEVIRRIVSLYSEHMGTEGEEFLDDADHKKKITPQQLKGKFIIRPTGSGNAADPDTRLQHSMAAGQVAEKYLGMSVQLAQRPDLLNHFWALSRAQLIAMDIHNIEELIGDQPEIPQGGQPGQMGGQPQPMLPQMMGMQNHGSNGQNGSMGGMAQPQPVG